MKKINILFVLGVTLLGSMLVFSENGFLKSAYALSVSTVTIGDMSGNGYMSYASGSGLYVINRASGNFATVNPNTHAISTYSVTSAGETNQLDIYCSGLYCYSTYSGGGLPDHIIQFNAQTGVKVRTFSVDQSGADINIPSLSTIGGVGFQTNGWFAGICVTTNNRILFNIQGQVLGTCGGNNLGANNPKAVFQDSNTSVGVTTGAGSNGLSMWNPQDGTRTCQVNVAVGNGGAITSYLHNYYVSVSTTGINKYDTSCVAGTGITNIGFATQVQALVPLPAYGVFAVGGNTQTSFMNITSSNISTLAYSASYAGFTGTDNYAGARMVFSDTNFNQLSTTLDISTTSDPLVIIQLATSSGSSGGTPNTCGSTASIPHCYGDVNCDIGNNANILGCQIALNPNGGALASASQSTTSSVNFLLGQVGLVNSTNTNIKTNGTGYMLTGITMGVMVAVFWLASGGQLREIPTFVWMLGTLGVLGLSTAFGWVDQTFLIIGILAIIALASTKILSTLELGGKF